MSFALILIALAVVQRVLETIYAARNARALIARGGVEIGRKHYPLIVALHACWLAVLILALPTELPIHFIPLILFLVLQGLRIWVIATLGPYWTTRIITIPGAPLIRHGPYRFFRHPNYLIGDDILRSQCGCSELAHKSGEPGPRSTQISRVLSRERHPPHLLFINACDFYSQKALPSALFEIKNHSHK